MIIWSSIEKNKFPIGIPTRLAWERNYFFMFLIKKGNYVTIIIKVLIYILVFLVFASLFNVIVFF